MSHRQLEGIASGNKHVKFAFPWSPGIYYQRVYRAILSTKN